MASRQKPSKRKQAESAFWILNDCLGEIHAGRVAHIMALYGPKRPEKFFRMLFEDKKYIPWYSRLGIGGIAIALCKFKDLWEKGYLKDLLSAKKDLKVGEYLCEETKVKRIRKFRNEFIAHYASHPMKLRTSAEKVDEWLIAMGIENEKAFVDWTKRVIKDLDQIKNALKRKYKVAK